MACKAHFLDSGAKRMMSSLHDCIALALLGSPNTWKCFSIPLQLHLRSLFHHRELHDGGVRSVFLGIAEK